jgi:hypothetical protein
VTLKWHDESLNDELLADDRNCLHIKSERNEVYGCIKKNGMRMKCGLIKLHRAVRNFAIETVDIEEQSRGGLHTVHSKAIW